MGRLFGNDVWTETVSFLRTPAVRPDRRVPPGRYSEEAGFCRKIARWAIAAGEPGAAANLFEYAGVCDEWELDAAAERRR